MKFTSPKKTPDGRYFLKVSNDDNSRVLLQLNKTVLKTKLSESLDCTLGLSDLGQAKIKEIDSLVVKEAENSSELWFGKKLGQATLKSAYTGLSEDTLNVNKVQQKGVCLLNIFNHKRDALAQEDIEIESECDVIVEFSGVWFMKKTYGPIWKLVQVKTRKEINTYPSDYMFVDDSGSESDYDCI